MASKIHGFFERHVFAVMMILTLILATLYIAFEKYHWDLEAEHRRWWKQATFKSVVVGRYEVPNSRGEVHTIIESNGVRENLILSGHFYRQLAIGDSLLKRSGNNEAIIKRPDGTAKSFSLFSGEQTLFKWE